MARKGNEGDQAVVVLTTAGSDDQAMRLAEALVERRQAACVNLVPGMRSVYRWKGKLWDDEEILLLVKTTAARFEAVRDTIRELHSYELPEVIALPVSAGDPSVLEWLTGAVTPDPKAD